MRNYTVSQVADILMVNRTSAYKIIENFKNRFRDETTGMWLIPESDLLSYQLPVRNTLRKSTGCTTVRREMLNKLKRRK